MQRYLLLGAVALMFACVQESPVKSVEEDGLSEDEPVDGLEGGSDVDPGPGTYLDDSGSDPYDSGSDPYDSGDSGDPYDSDTGEECPEECEEVCGDTDRDPYTPDECECECPEECPVECPEVCEDTDEDPYTPDVCECECEEECEEEGCTLTQGFWKNHPEDWPVESLVLGDETYTQAELLALLEEPVEGDASTILAYQLIAAKLNVASGAVSCEEVEIDGRPLTVEQLIARADQLLAPFEGKLPYELPPSENQDIVDIAALLDQFNNGYLGPDHCPS